MSTVSKGQLLLNGSSVERCTRAEHEQGQTTEGRRCPAALRIAARTSELTFIGRVISQQARPECAVHFANSSLILVCFKRCRSVSGLCGESLLQVTAPRNSLEKTAPAGTGMSSHGSLGAAPMDLCGERLQTRQIWTESQMLPQTASTPSRLDLLHRRNISLQGRQARHYDDTMSEPFAARRNDDVAARSPHAFATFNLEAMRHILFDKPTSRSCMCQSLYATQDSPRWTGHEGSVDTCDIERWRNTNVH